ncbi:MAG TPA: aldo/keto reductase [Pyrinomonadaceae bacterium]|nr:aldo/keto reductase [Pyrinomonadaceae bacterium]
MKFKKLGNSDLEISAIGLGCMGMSEFYGETNEKESLETLEKALDLGLNFYDTADMYGPFTNEELLGKFIQGKREKVVIATKFGIERDPNDWTKRGINGKPEYVRRAVEGSLKRLGIDEIDLYYQHRVDPSTPIEETVGAMAQLVKEGKVKYLGLSEASAETLRKANAIHPISALQSEYSIWSRDIEGEILQTCGELGVTLVAYSPLGRGFLTGRYKKPSDLSSDDYRHHTPRFQGENFEKNIKLANKVEEISKRKGCTPAQLALAWVINKEKNIVPIPGTKKVQRLEENLGALNVKLTAEDFEEIEPLSKLVQGLRYPADYMQAVNR